MNNARISKQTSMFDNCFKQLLKGPGPVAGAYLYESTTREDVYRLAMSIIALFDGFREKGPVCVCTDNRSLIAASLMASFSGGPKLIIPHSCSPEALREIRETVPFSRAITDDHDAVPEGVEAVVPVIAEQGTELPQLRKPDEMCVRLFTGGTTGKPKFWSKTARNLLTESFYQAQKFNITESDLIMSTAPPQHIYGLLFSVLIPLVSGARVIGSTRTYPQEIISGLTDLPVTLLVSLPVHYKLLGNYRIPRNSLRYAFSSAGMLDEQHGNAFHENTGTGVFEIYGSTETGGIAIRCRQHGYTSFRPFDIVDWKIEGERLMVRSDFLSPELERDGDGYYKTGDLAEHDSDDGFILHGRIDGIVKVAGKRVDLEDIREKIKEIPDVRDATVISLPVKGGRENEISALVETGLALADLKRKLVKKLESYAVPRRLKIVDRIPVTSAGKFDRDEIRKLFNTI